MYYNVFLKRRIVIIIMPVIHVWALHSWILQGSPSGAAAPDETVNQKGGKGKRQGAGLEVMVGQGATVCTWQTNGWSGGKPLIVERTFGKK